MWFLLRLHVTQNALQLAFFFFFSLFLVLFLDGLAKVFLANVLRLFTTEVCDQDLIHSLNTSKYISVKIALQVVIRDDACGT